MRISELDGLRVALWGWGREGQAAWRALRDRESQTGGRHPGRAVPPMSLTLFCQPGEAEQVRALGDANLAVETQATAARLSAFDVVIKSPGISPYSAEAEVAAARGTRFIGGTALWFAERPDARTLCVTGTKGKSTTSALAAHLLRAAGVRTALAGNIGLPLLELLGAEAEAWVIELSSYQTRDVAAAGVSPHVAVVTNVHPEHLDWHGSETRYVEDKLALLTQARPRIAVLDALDPRLAALELPHSELRWFNRDDGWHLRGTWLHRGDTAVIDTAALPLPGAHNRRNLCAALAAIEAIGVDAAPLAAHAAGFVPLPHRLQTLGERSGLVWVNDSISTTPQAALAALDACAGSRVAILVGGHDRGLDWAAFAIRMRTAPPRAVVTMGANGPRIHAALAGIAAGGGFALRAAEDLPAAVAAARAALGEAGGVVLLSPGAPSFGPYRDYTERGRHFATLAGFDPERITAIPGLGIA
ncbi:UDP-N-acetylmuramoyl-L-alanine--D-glutamate ligase [Luteimonas sp. RD2P54]|uniref:UDP-N-acetylmuramoyl-L-alanine--L-glutamate ligase n=1 Tax=Luteimonas endophytica TaxID=3042023 RepID=A0ABT6JB44_9GAMM|nr:UDP-N-acetylmuramoyl-L-alanine--D-glutamate ligase [Luteimonas endophytica]MDH5824050.1 UDP-N-acetylmuramoyl-L-alanine--D-glutamate ligase [Luteimonas endophytica]